MALVDAFAVGEYYVRSSGIGSGELRIGDRSRGDRALGCGGTRAERHRARAGIRLQRRTHRELAQKFGAQVLVDPATQPPFDAWRDVAREHGITTPPVVFECVGAPGLVQQTIATCEMWTRIYVAGAWYTDDTINCTSAARKGVTIQFGGGPFPTTGTARSTRCVRADSIHFRASARSSASTRYRPHSTLRAKRRGLHGSSCTPAA